MVEVLVANWPVIVGAFGGSVAGFAVSVWLGRRHR